MCYFTGAVMLEKYCQKGVGGAQEKFKRGDGHIGGVVYRRRGGSNLLHTLV